MIGLCGMEDGTTETGKFGSVSERVKEKARGSLENVDIRNLGMRIQHPIKMISASHFQLLPYLDNHRSNCRTWHNPLPKTKMTFGSSATGAFPSTQSLSLE